MQHRKTLMLVLTALFAALTAIGAFFKIPFALAAISRNSCSRPWPAFCSARATARCRRPCMC